MFTRIRLRITHLDIIEKILTIKFKDLSNGKFGTRTKIEALKLVGKSDFWNKNSELEYNPTLVEGDLNVSQMALLVNQDNGRPKEKRKIVKMVN